MRRKFSLATFSVAVLLVTAGCGGDGGGAAAPAGGGEAAGGGGGGTGVCNHALTIAKPDGAITVQSNNPFVATSTAMGLGYINSMVEPVGMMNMANPAEGIIPWLASDIQWNDDYTEITLTPREGVTFSNGDPMTAEDIAYIYELRMNNSALDTGALNIQSVNIVDGKVHVTFPRSMYVRQNDVVNQPVLPKAYMETIPVADLTTDPMLGLYGTGPYTLDSFTTQAVIMGARDDWWGGPLAVPQLNFVSYNDNTGLVTALANGEVDWDQAWIANVQSSFLNHDPEHNRQWTPAGLGIDAMFVNTTRPPFDDPAFRQAVNMVIDREAHRMIAREGAVPAITSVTGLPSPAGDPFVAPQFQGHDYVVDVEGAKQVLEAAGYTGVGTSLVDPHGNPVSFTLSVPQGWSDYVTGSTLIVDAVQALGVDAHLETPDADTWWQNRSNGNFDAILHWTDTGATPWNLYDNTMGGRWLRPIGEAADYNFGRFENPNIDGYLNTYETAHDDASRQEALNNIQDIFVNEVPVMPVGTRPFIISYNTRNYVGWPDETNPYIVSDFTQQWMPMVLQHLECAN